MFVWVVHLALFISLLISSISVAYWVTASTPPCLMLLLILMPIMGLVMPCLVVMVAVRFWLRRSVRSHVAPLHPCLFITYMMASSHAKPEDYRKPDDYRIYVKLAQYDPEISNF